MEIPAFQLNARLWAVHAMRVERHSSHKNAVFFLFVVTHAALQHINVHYHINVHHVGLLELYDQHGFSFVPRALCTDLHYVALRIRSTTTIRVWHYFLRQITA